MKLSGWWCVVISVVAACGGDDDGTCEVEGGKACFEAPTAALVAWEEDVSSAPNLACAKPVATTSTQAVVISGALKQYTSSAPVAGVKFDAFADINFGSMVFSFTTGTDGTFTAAIPSGSPSILHMKAEGAAVLSAYALYQQFDVTMATLPNLDYRAPTQPLLDIIQTTTRVEQDMTKSVIAAVVTDCDGKTLEHAIVTVSSTTKTASHVGGVNIFYGAAGDYPLPILRSERIDTNNNGAAGLLNVPTSGKLIVQAWGFVSDADVSKGTGGLKLIAEWETVTIAGGAVALPLRAGT